MYVLRKLQRLIEVFESVIINLAGLELLMACSVRVICLLLFCVVCSLRVKKNLTLRMTCGTEPSYPPTGSYWSNSLEVTNPTVN